MVGSSGRSKTGELAGAQGGDASMGQWEACYKSDSVTVCIQEHTLGLPKFTTSATFGMLNARVVLRAL